MAGLGANLDPSPATRPRLVGRRPATGERAESMSDGLRYLIVNADDFGLSAGVNRGIIMAHQRGIVTSASLMVRYPAAPAAVRIARDCPALSLGLHVDLCEWVYRDDQWQPLYQVVDAADPVAVGGELRRQIDVFRRLAGRDPTHLDSHQHLHRSEPARRVFVEAAADLSVPLRDCSAQVRYNGSFYGQDARGYPCHEALTVESLVRVIEQLPPGWTELGCHPGLDEDIASVYRFERTMETRTLCDPAVRAVLERCGVRLRSFASGASR
jgi:chitin disaccharide deacetylase